MSKYTMDMIFTEGYFLRVPRFFLSKLKASELLLLCFLITWHAMKAKPEKQGWFFCKADVITEEMSISRVTQCKLMKALEDKGYIETYVEGMPPTRWIKLNVKQITEEIEELIQDHKDKQLKRYKKEKKRKADKKIIEEEEDEYLDLILKHKR